jgi:hypothetical protein
VESRIGDDAGMLPELVRPANQPRPWRFWDGVPGGKAPRNAISKSHHLLPDFRAEHKVDVSRIFLTTSFLNPYNISLIEISERGTQRFLVLQKNPVQINRDIKCRAWLLQRIRVSFAEARPSHNETRLSTNAVKSLVRLLLISTFAAITPTHLYIRRSLSIDNTIGIVFGVLAFVLGVLSVAFAWAMWQLQRRQNRRPRQPTPASHVQDDDWELRRIVGDHHGNFVTL